MKYKINTYGCQMNIHESEKIAGILKELGYIEIDNEQDQYDIIVFNTCCIRDTAEKKILSHIGQVKNIKKNNPSLIVAVVGCMSQQSGNSEDLKKKFPFIDIILGTNNINLLADSINNVKNNKKKTLKIDENENPEIFEYDKAFRTSGANAWVNIMYGCNNFCTYCIVPYVRGRERSRDADKIICEVKDLISQGYKEITLLGQNVNSYGKDLNNGKDFAYLLEEIAKIQGDHRIRFMTSHPKDLNEKVIDLIAKYDTLCKNIHLPLQSGSNKVLQAMNRHYTKEDYMAIIDYIKLKIPNCGITTDIIVGFPNETEEDFIETLDLVEKVGFSGAFTYIYSPRKGTPASLMEQLPYKTKSERIQRLIKLQNRITKEISKNYEGKIYRVLCEDTKGAGKVCGRTDCNRLVTFDGDASLIGKFCNVLILNSKSASLFGELVEESNGK